MEPTRKRIRKEYAPLNVAVSLICLTSGSPVTQVFAAKTSTYEPNREVTPTVLMPEITLNASDGSLQSPYGNDKLATSSMQWYVNDVRIELVTELAGKYEILTSGSTKGGIIISKNVPVGRRYAFRFEGEIADNRLGVNIPIKTEELTLSTSDKSEDAYSLDLIEDTLIKYNPFTDKLHLYEYKVAQGLVIESSSARQAAIDSNAYYRTIPITLYKGTEVITTGFTMKLFKVNSNLTLTEITAANDDNEVESITTSAITLDLRLITKADYMAIAYVDNAEVARSQFSVNRLYPDYRIRQTNGTSIAPTDVDRYDIAMVDCNGHIVECPESIIKMIWKTDSASERGVIHNEGAETLYLLSKTGIGDTSDDDWLDEYIESEQKEAYSIATDEDGYDFTDENGDTFIFN